MYNPQLDTFLRAADYGSFSKAAESSFITTTAVMKQINLLENNLGVKLFHRSHRGLILTKAGESLYRDARQLIQFSEESIARAQNAMSREDPVVRVGTSPMTSPNALMDLWPEIHRMVPELKLKMVSFENTPENAREILENLGQRIDVVCGIFDDTFLSNRTCQGFLLEEKRLECTMSLDHPLVRRGRLTMEDLYGQTVWLIHPGWSGSLDRLRQGLTIHKEIHIVDFDFYNLEVFNRCENNRDILIAPPTTENIHPMLTTVPMDWDYTIPYGLLHSPHPTAPVQQLLSALSAIIGTNA